jgi:MFS family permease
MNLIVLFALLVGLDLGLIFMNIPPAINELMALYRVSYTQISLLISALLWSHALTQIPGGMVVDRLGMRRTMFVSLLCIGLGHALPLAAPSLGLAIMGRVLTGMGTGLSFVSIMKMVALYAPGGRSGAYQAFFAGCFSLGSIGAYLLLPHLVVLGWRWTYLLPGMFSWPLLVMLSALRLERRTGKPISPLPMGQILRIQAGWILGIYHALSYGSVLNLGNWIPSLLAEVRGDASAIHLAWGGALVMLISGLGRLAGGFVIFRVPSVLIANGSILILSILFLGLFLIPIPGVVLTLALLASWFASVNFGAFFHLASRATPPESLGTFFGFVNLLANMGAIGFTLMFGWFKDDRGSFSWGFAVLAGLSLVAFALGRRPLRRKFQEE